ncbi:MAG: polymerase subunit [Candidatus Taylorbacteria bacterium]|nr:polymerase subunit [Candidatus Taylorbacteria bacterium]
MNDRFTQHKKKLMDFYVRRKRMPSFAELAQLMRVKSKDTAYSFANNLIEEKLLSRDSTGRLVPGKKWNAADDLGIGLLGVVEAGFPSPSDGGIMDTITLDDYVIKNREASFMLRVKGDSMIDAGIREGDMVIVERAKTPREGDIVIARVDGDFTMKYYRTRSVSGAAGGKRQIYLEAANSKYKPIIPESELAIEAVVVAVVRTYHR